MFAELEASNYSCERIHGGLEQEDRFAVMDGFKMGNFRYLVATDVAARGIDIDNVSLVINYDVPMEKETMFIEQEEQEELAIKEKRLHSRHLMKKNSLKPLKDILALKFLQWKLQVLHEVARGKAAFEEKISGRRVVRNNKTARINKDIMKLHFSGGKKKKLRAVDFVGTIAKIPGVTAEDIGIITIQENLSYVDILNGKGSLVLQAMENTPIKGKKLKVSKAIK